VLEMFEKNIARILDIIADKGYLKENEIIYYLKNEFDKVDIVKALNYALEKGYIKKYGAKYGFEEEYMEPKEKRLRYREVMAKMYDV
jgi:VIT1/CCC1 family predicted Fe2+/Mn2+ transporter